MAGVDLATFQFDPLLAWSVFFMNGDKTIYGRFGTSSPQAKRDRLDSNRNHTVAGLKAAMRQALAVHKSYADDPATWRPRLAGKTGAKPLWRFAEKTPAARKYGRLKRVKGQHVESCLHCHEVQRTAIDSYFMTNKPLPDRMLWMYPHPAVVGVTLSKLHSSRVTRVAPDSAASVAGLRVDDDIVSFRGQPLLSVADFQWVLHNAPDDGGTIPLQVKRGEEMVSLTLKLAPLWRRAGDFGWRYRVAGYAAWLWGGVTLVDAPGGVRVAGRSPHWFKRPNRSARRALQRGDLIVAVDGKSDWTRSTYLAYLMREKKLGSTVKVVVMRNGKRTPVAFRMPKTRPEVQGH